MLLSFTNKTVKTTTQDVNLVHKYNQYLCKNTCKQKEIILKLLILMIAYKGPNQHIFLIKLKNLVTNKSTGKKIIFLIIFFNFGNNNVHYFL